MTMITRIDPFRELATLQDRFTSLFENFTETPGKEQLAAGSFVPQWTSMKTSTLWYSSWKCRA